MAETLGSVAARTVAVAAKTNTIALKTEEIAAKTAAVEQRLDAMAASIDDRFVALAERFQSIEHSLIDVRRQIGEEGEQIRRHIELASGAGESVGVAARIHDGTARVIASGASTREA